MIPLQQYLLAVSIFPCISAVVVSSRSPICGTRIAICSAIRSTNETESLDETDLYTVLLPSINGTITKEERDCYNISLYLGASQGDVFFASVQDQIRQQSAEWLPVTIDFWPQDKPNKIPFNPMMRKAYEDGNDYFVRVNDDTEFLQPRGWMTSGMQKLLSFSPPNIGVVGPLCGQGNTNALTHDMTHRTHLQIFNMSYYPEVFSNWFLDEWMSEVYGSARTARLDESWIVHHHVEHHGGRERYNISREEGVFLQPEIQRGRQAVEKWIETHSSSAQLVINMLSLPRVSRPVRVRIVNLLLFTFFIGISFWTLVILAFLYRWIFLREKK